MKLPRSVNNVGLMAARPVRWLLGNEPEVANAVRKFVRGETETNFLDVAIPPSWTETLAARLNPRRPVMLPVVRLHMKIVQQLDEWYVLIEASDHELDLLAEMERAKIMAKQQELAVVRRHLAT